MTTIPSPVGHLVEPLTAAEENILNLLAQGLSDKEIGLRLSIAPITVRGDHKQNFYDKLDLQPGFRNRKWAVYCARQLGLLPGVDQEEDYAPPGDNPYKGLDAFQQHDAHVFFGRETFVERLLARLSQNESRPRFLAVVGPSGSGKSSILRAGLIPALENDRIPGAHTWTVATMFPRVNPFFELETALRAVAIKQQPGLLELLQRDSNGLVRAARLILPEERPLLLVIDQFEETFTQVKDSALARRFMDLIYAAVTDPRSTVRVVVTLRADFLDRPLMYPDFSWLVQEHTAMVVPLTPDELERAITLPAQHAHVTIDPGLVARLVAEAHEQPGALPLLEFALTELYDNRIGSTITMSTYDEIGGVQRALAAQADKVFAGLSVPQQEAARQLFLRLITLGEGTEDVRRRVPTRELASLDVPTEIMEYVTNFLAANRLLTLDLDPATKEPLVEVAHEALIREWVQLRVWLDESRNDVRMERLLAVAVDDWQRHTRQEGYLMQGAKLAQFEGWRATTDLALTAAEHVFLDASIAERERQHRRRRRIRNLVLAATFAVASVMAALALWANNQRGRAEDEKQHAETAREAEADARAGAQNQAAILLAAQAESELENGFYDRAVLLALEALENYPYTPQAEHALGQAVSYNRALQQYTGHTSAVTSADWSPDGTRLATSSADNTVHIWDPITGQQIMVINLPAGITGNIMDMGLAVKWSPDGEQLLTITGDRFWLGSQDYDLIWRDAVTGEQIRTIEIPNQAEPAAGEGISTSVAHYITGAAAAFAPDSGRLATVGGDNTALIWDAALTRQEWVLTGHEDAVNGVDWSPDGTRLATASVDGTARIWDAQSGKGLLVLAGHEGAVNQVIWSPDGTQLATAGKDGTARLWDAQTGEVVQTIEPGAGIVWSLAWSPDGSFLVTGTDDARIRFWEIDSGKTVAEFNGHDKFVTDLAWSAVDNRLASAGADGRVRIWNAAPSTAMLSLPESYFGNCWFDWSSDGRHLSVTAGDWYTNTVPGNLAIWDVLTGQPVVENLAPITDDWHWYLALFSPNDRLLLAGGIAGSFGQDLTGASTAYVLDAQTGEVVRTFELDEANSLVKTLAWSPDGTQVAAGMGLTGTLAIWDFQTGALVLEAAHCGETVADWVNDLEWSPDGKKIAVACGSQSVTDWPNWVSVWDAATFDLLFTLPDPNPPAGYYSVAWSPDSTRILTTGGTDELGTQDNPVRIWDGNTGEELLAILRHTGQVVWGSWSPDGSRVVTGSSDDTTRVWDAETGAELLTLSTPNNWFAVPEWSPKGDALAVGLFSFDTPSIPIEVFHVWQSTNELIAYARECCVFRDLTPEERQQFGLPERAE